MHSRNIEAYIQNTYGKKVKATTYIAYGADVRRSGCSEEAVQAWFNQFGIRKNEYYLIVGRFVPENNYETMIREFMASNTSRDLVIVTNVEQNPFYDHLVKTTGFAEDKRIKFVGTVYDAELIKKIREERGYIHGHEVGGTNPRLLEDLASTRDNMLLDVGFNREVAEDTALYWDKTQGSLSRLIEQADRLSEQETKLLDINSTQRVARAYSWEHICSAYEAIFSASEEAAP